MNVLPRQCDVLIVGAGPTGLVLAIRLQQFGVETLLIDRLPERLPWSRALGIQPRSMEILDALEVADTVAKASRGIVGLELFNQRGRLFELDIDAADCRYPHIHSCPQAELERVLEARYLAAGGRFVRALTLTDFTQTGTGVTATLEDAQGARHGVDCQLMVGCDGAHSTVRDRLGLGFEGVAYPDRFLLADLDIDWDLSRDRGHGFLLPSGLLLALPLPEGWRLVLQEDPAQEGTPAGEGDVEPEPPLELFGARLAEAFDEPPVLGPPRWSSRFTLHRRLVGRYRVNRVLLAGDACHVQSPIGAQGMNTGIADAFNLAWKAALFLRGHGGGALLDAYETERRPVARQMLRNVDLMSRTVLARSVVWRGARDSVLRLAGRTRLGNLWLRRASQLDVHYRDSALVASGPELFASLGKEGPEPGDRLPDVTLTDIQADSPVSLHRLLREPAHHLLIQMSSQLDHHEIVAAYALADRIPATLDGLVRVHVVTGEGWPPPLHELREFPVMLLADDSGAFRARYGDHAALWLMRPDGHLGYRAPIGDGDHLLHYLREFFRRH